MQSDQVNQLISDIRTIAENGGADAVPQMQEALARFDEAQSEEARVREAKRARREAKRKERNQLRYRESLIYDFDDIDTTRPNQFTFRYRGVLTYDQFLELIEYGFNPHDMIRFVEPADVADNLDEIIESGEVGPDAVVNRLIEHYGDSGIPEEVVNKLLPLVHNRKRLLAARRVTMTRAQLQRVIEQEKRPSVDDFIYAAIAAFEVCAAGDEIPDEFERRWHDDYEVYLCVSRDEDDEYDSCWSSDDDIF